ncbi:MAG: hypothetical protein H0W23_04660 [Chloroflexia bacterium]|nr:hypothetical protein [Chloroflexia bacterium]
MEPRPQRPRTQINQAPASPSSPGAPGASAGPQHRRPGVVQDGGDPATLLAPSRTDYDYSPLDLAPSGQRRRRQFVAAAIGGFTVLLLGALSIFGYLLLRDDEPDRPSAEVIAAQTVVAQATSAADQTIVAQAAVDQTAAAGPVATPPPPPTEPAPTDPAAAGPTEPPAVATTSAADTAGALNPDQLAALLPTNEIAPEGLDTPTDNERDLATVVEALGGSRAAETNLETWGWTGNVERSFSASDPAAIAGDATNALVVSAHGFATPEAAAEALPFFSDILVDGSGYEEVEAPDLGDLARLLQVSNEDGSTNVALYVQDGTVLYRVGASSVAGDPTPDAVSVMTSILEANATA